MSTPDTQQLAEIEARLLGRLELNIPIDDTDIRHLLALVRTQTEALEKAEAELEMWQMRLAACTTAALGNTPESAAQRISKDNPYYSATYGDVCAAVDREMALRAEVAGLQQGQEARVMPSLIMDYAKAQRKRDEALAEVAQLRPLVRQCPRCNAPVSQDENGYECFSCGWEGVTLNNSGGRTP